MQKISLLTAMIIASTGILSGCNDSDDVATHAVEFSVNVDDQQFSFGAPKTLGLFALEAGKSEVAQFIINNEQLKPTANKNIFLLNQGLPSSGKMLDIYLYSPYNTVGYSGNGVGVEIPSDQTSTLALEESDIMLATINQVDASKQSLTANFAHLTAQVELEILFPEDYIFEASNANIKLLAKPYKGEIVLAGNKIVTSDDRKDITLNLLNAKFDSKSHQATGIRAMVLPEIMEAGIDFIKLDMGGRTKILKLSKELSFEAGKRHLLTIDAANEMTFEMTVLPWDDRFGEEEVMIQTIYMFDLEGNRYDAVRIGDLYWTTSNLKTTYFSDATKIPYSKNGNEWAGLIGNNHAAFTYYGDDQETASKLGAFYNWHCVATGKLCPEGWRVPSREEWLAMREVAGGMYQAGTRLKSISGWEDRDGVSKPEYQGEDQYGFNAIPTNYIDDRGQFDHYDTGYGPNSITAWWSTTSDESQLRGWMFAVYYMAPNLNEELLYANSGLSVRCVRAINLQ
ncbi:MAG: FISUMP domain-containing protein [Alistipes sp.]